MNQHRWICLSTVLALGLASSFAHAQTKPASPPATTETPADKTRKLFEEGTADLNAGKFAEAAEKLRAAWQQKSSFDIAGNLGAALLKLGSHAEAARFLSYAVDNFPAGGKPSLKKWIEDLLSEATKEVAAVRVKVNVDGADVSVNGQALGKSPVTNQVYVVPGAVIVEASKEGFEAGRVERKSEKGSAIEVDLTLKVKQAVQPVVPERPAWPAYVLGGVGVASVIAGGVLLGVAHGNQADVEKRSAAIFAGGIGCPADARCADLASTAHAADAASRAGVGLLIGGAAVGAAGVLYRFWPSPQAKQGAVRVVPVASSQGGGVIAFGEF